MPGIFGRGLRETRLTALLGYLVSLQPRHFADFLGVTGEPVGVVLEADYERDRADIRFETTDGVCVIEAKVHSEDPADQAKKYKAKWHVLLTSAIQPASKNQGTGLRYVSWSDLSKTLESLSSRVGQPTKFMCGEMLTYMEEHNMARVQDIPEIYAREINEESTLNLFLRGQLYGCKYQKGGLIAKARYFAPHFGWAIANQHPGVLQGISYVSRIEALEQVHTWNDLLAVLKKRRGKAWVTRHGRMLSDAKRWHRPAGDSRYFLFLGPPRLVFNPPVDKKFLQAGSGWLSKRNFTFDELFSAWSHSTPGRK